jgi:hypothetical protein
MNDSKFIASRHPWPPNKNVIRGNVVINGSECPPPFRAKAAQFMIRIIQRACGIQTVIIGADINGTVTARGTAIITDVSAR